MRLIDWLRSIFSPKPPPTPPPAPLPEDQSTVNDLLLRFHNVERSKRGVGLLTLNVKLIQVAQDQALYCAQSRKLTHFGPHGETVGQRVARVDYDYRFCGENAAERPGSGDPQDVSWAMTQWLQSPPHRANMVKPDFTEFGGGWADSGNVRYMVAVFGTAY